MACFLVIFSAGILPSGKQILPSGKQMFQASLGGMLQYLTSESTMLRCRSLFLALSAWMCPPMQAADPQGCLVVFLHVYEQHMSNPSLLLLELSALSSSVMMR